MTITQCRVCSRLKTVAPWRLSNQLTCRCDKCTKLECLEEKKTITFEKKYAAILQVRTYAHKVAMTHK